MPVNDVPEPATPSHASRLRVWRRATLSPAANGQMWRRSWSAGRQRSLLRGPRRRSNPGRCDRSLQGECGVISPHPRCVCRRYNHRTSQARYHHPPDCTRGRGSRVRLAPPSQDLSGWASQTQRLSQRAQNLIRQSPGLAGSCEQIGMCRRWALLARGTFWVELRCRSWPA
jgi:hypothetical protein